MKTYIIRGYEKTYDDDGKLISKVKVKPVVEEEPKEELLLEEKDEYKELFEQDDSSGDE